MCFYKHINVPKQKCLQIIFSWMITLFNHYPSELFTIVPLKMNKMLYNKYPKLTRIFHQC